MIDPYVEERLHDLQETRERLRREVDEYDRSIRIGLLRGEWMDLCAAMEYASYLMGPCVETATLARFRQKVDAVMDR